MIPASPNCWGRCERAAWPPTKIKTYLSRCSLIASNPRALTHHPLIQVMLAWQDNPVGQLNLGDLQATPMPIDTRTARMTWCFR